jgi:ornithine cyclodeaminase/alanine dehydrogenase-like protein (mu-crystallin family)
LLSLEECIAAVENAFLLLGQGRTEAPGVLGIHVQDGGFHIKAGLLPLSRPYFAAKVNANFPANGQRFGLPTIQGVILLADCVNGQPLALMDSMEVTALRTAAATAVAAKYLARSDSRVATICGCGTQGRAQLRALTHVLKLSKAYAWDIVREQAREFSQTMAGELGIPVVEASNPADALQESDVCVTCTTSRQWLVGREMVRPGTFIAAVGADHPKKQELDPALLATAKVICDVTEQCAAIGDLHHALDTGVMTRAKVHAELSEIVARKKPGRTSEQEIIVFDSTGMALQDVAAAALIYENAVRLGRGMALDFAA